MVIEKFNNRRRYARVAVDLTAYVQKEDGSDFAIKVRDLSEGGIGMDCDQAAAYALLPAEQRTPGPVYGVALKLRFKLPWSSDKNIDAHCNVAFFRRLAQDRFHFGLQFEDTESRGLDRLRHFVREQYSIQQKRQG